MLSDQLGLKLLNFDFFNTFLRAAVTQKCCCSVLKKLLLPAIEDPGLKLILVTQVGYCNMLDQVSGDEKWKLSLLRCNFDPFLTRTLVRL